MWHLLSKGFFYVSVLGAALLLITGSGRNL